MAVNFGVNYLAVIVAAVVALVIGFAYYAPQTFGKRWMAYLGTTQAELGNPGPMGMATGVVASLGPAMTGLSQRSAVRFGRAPAALRPFSAPGKR